MRRQTEEETDQARSTTEAAKRPLIPRALEVEPLMNGERGVEDVCQDYQVIPMFVVLQLELPYPSLKHVMGQVNHVSWDK